MGVFTNTSSTSTLLSHQWERYAEFHRSRGNLLIHLVAVPVFLLANVVCVVTLFRGEWISAGTAVAAMAGSMIAQGRGHRLETMPPEPFTGPLNAVARIFAEQWLTFPRFVLTGGWSHARRQRDGR
jgi:hypothetical protein